MNKLKEKIKETVNNHDCLLECECGIKSHCIVEEEYKNLIKDLQSLIPQWISVDFINMLKEMLWWETCPKEYKKIITEFLQRIETPKE